MISEYKHFDDAPYFGYNYYRLKQIDFDGDFEYSQIEIAIINGKDLPDVIVYPNPTRRVTTIRAVEAFEADAQVEIVSAAGQILNILTINSGNNVLELDLSQYPAGFYFVNIKYNDFKKLVHRVMKIQD